MNSPPNEESPIEISPEAHAAGLADGLSRNNPDRFQLMDFAEDFRKRAKKLERLEAEQQQESDKVRRKA